MTRRHRLLPVVVTFVLVTAGCAGIVPATQQTTADAGTKPSTGTSTPRSATATTPTTSMTPSSSAVAGYAHLYDRTIDSVVEITAETRRGRRQGSGFVYSSDGYIVTNQHVVGQSERVQVRFQSGAWKTARVVGTDVYSDLAVVHVESLPPGVDPLPVARNEPEPGQRVVALGSPLGYEGSITHGIVSGINRSMSTARGFSIPDTIQTDAPINPGNSGGPLVSLDGTVVGVNRAKRGDNLGFAISADVVRRVVPSLIANGSYRHSYLGIGAVPVTPPMAQARGMSTARGVLVVSVLEDGPSGGVLQPAERVLTDAGVVYRGGDVLLRVEGNRIRSQQDLAQYLLLETHPGEEITVTVRRDGTLVEETIVLGTRPELSAESPV